MQKLRDRIKDFESIEAELTKLTRQEEEDRADIAAVMSDGLVSDEAEMTKLSNAETRLRLIGPRRVNLTAALQRVADEVAKEHAVQRSLFNKAISRVREAKLAALEKALAPFYGDNNSKRLKRDIEVLDVPAVLEIGRLAAPSEFFQEPTPHVLCGSARRFFEHVARVSKKLGW